MNRTQLPQELKAVVCQQILKGKWTVEQAADLTTYSIQSIKRWLRDLPGPGTEAAAQASEVKPPESRRVDPGLRRILDEAVERVPLLRQRSLVAYVRRHYGCKVPKRVAAAYLKERGLVERLVVKVEQPPEECAESAPTGCRTCRTPRSRFEDKLMASQPRHSPEEKLDVVLRETGDFSLKD